MAESSLSPIATTPRSFRILSGLTRLIPRLPHASGLSNRIVKPLYCRRHRGRYRVKVWGDIEMIVDPADTVGGNLAFIPQLFDVWERNAIQEHLPRGGVFVDVGANIGSYTLWAARQAGPHGRVLAYEAEQNNFAALVENIALNGFRQIDAFQVGVSGKRETLRLRMSAGNSGGHSFALGIAGPSSVEVEVKCEPLADLVAHAGRINFMKLDIEGFEQRVLSQFFDDVPADSPLRPRFILTEMLHWSVMDLSDTIRRAGYRLIKHSGYNALFARE